MNEKYIPSAMEMENAEQMMNPKQAYMSRKREESVDAANYLIDREAFVPGAPEKTLELLKKCHFDVKEDARIAGKVDGTDVDFRVEEVAGERRYAARVGKILIENPEIAEGLWRKYSEVIRAERFLDYKDREIEERADRLMAEDRAKELLNL